MSFICENREYVVRYQYHGKDVVKSHVWIEPEDAPRREVGDKLYVKVNGSKRLATVMAVV